MRGEGDFYLKKDRKEEVGRKCEVLYSLMGVLIINHLKAIGSYVLGGLAIAGLTLIAILFIRGGVWVSERVLPWLYSLFWGVIILDIIVLLPMGVFKRTRIISGFGLLYSSFFFGAVLWLWSLVAVYLAWGIIAVFIGLFLAGVGVVPIALLAFIKFGDWLGVGFILILLFLTYGSRILGMYFAED